MMNSEKGDCILCGDKIHETVKFCSLHDFMYCTRCVNTHILRCKTRNMRTYPCIHPRCKNENMIPDYIEVRC